jgi:N-glycosylase/DNA lyase
MNDFREMGKKSSDDIFKELCFCILTANYTAEGGIRIQREIGDGFLSLPEKELAKRLKQLGHRFPNTRARYIAEARQHRGALDELLSASGKTEREKREWVAENVKGLGYKEASHFLRNIGFENLAIIDFHIIDILAAHGIIEPPKTLSKKKYLETEGVLQKLAARLGMSLGELDLYLWCAETGKILK